MEEHILKLTNVHTQLLLQMQNEINIQMMNEQLISLQNELQSTKAALDEKNQEFEAAKLDFFVKEKKFQHVLDTKDKELEVITTKLNSKHKELQATNVSLDAAKRELQGQMENYKKDTENKENQIAFLQEDIRKQMADIQEYIKSQNQIGDKLHENDVLKLDERLTELLSNTISKTANDDISSIVTVFQSLEMKEPSQNISEPIEHILLNRMNFKLPMLNQLVEEFNEAFDIYENKFEILLTKMVNGDIYHIDDKQFILKLHLMPRKYHLLYFSLQ